MACGCEGKEEKEEEEEEEEEEEKEEKEEDGKGLLHYYLTDRNGSCVALVPRPQRTGLRMRLGLG